MPMARPPGRKTRSDFSRFSPPRGSKTTSMSRSGPQPVHGPRRHRTAFPIPHPRPRHQVHHRIRCRLHRDRRQDHQDTGAGTTGQRDRRALRRLNPPRTPRPHPDHQPVPCPPPSYGSTSGTSTITVHIEPWAKLLPYDPFLSRPRRSSTALYDATASAASYTNMSRSHEVRSVSGTHTAVRIPKRPCYDPEPPGPSGQEIQTWLHRLPRLAACIPPVLPAARLLRNLADRHPVRSLAGMPVIAPDEVFWYGFTTLLIPTSGRRGKGIMWGSAHIKWAQYRSRYDVVNEVREAKSQPARCADPAGSRRSPSCRSRGRTMPRRAAPHRPAAAKSSTSTSNQPLRQPENYAAATSSPAGQRSTRRPWSSTSESTDTPRPPRHTQPSPHA